MVEQIGLIIIWILAIIVGYNSGVQKGRNKLNKK